MELTSVLWFLCVEAKLSVLLKKYIHLHLYAYSLASGVVTEGVTSSSSLTLSLVGRGGYYVADIVRGTLVKPGEVVYLRSNPKIVLGTIKEIINNDQDTSWHLFIKGDYSPTTSSVFYARP
jgi:hypothetical protein